MNVGTAVGTSDGSKVVGGAVRGGKVGSGVGTFDTDGAPDSDGCNDSVGENVSVGKPVG